VEGRDVETEELNLDEIVEKACMCLRNFNRRLK
jgi:hypothetical protein